MSNFSAEIFIWTILQLWLNENVLNYYIHQKKCVGLRVNQKKNDSFEIFNSWNLSYVLLAINNNKFSFFWVFQPFLFCVYFYNFKKENIYYWIFVGLV